MLALAEIVQLSEWKEYAESTGCLSVKELLRRAAAIEQLLSERAWREGLLDANQTEDGGTDSESVEDQTAIRIMREIFFNAARVYLATVINGPFPRGKFSSHQQMSQLTTSPRSSRCRTRRL
jgi:hypothetical protein